MIAIRRNFLTCGLANPECHNETSTNEFISKINAYPLGGSEQMGSYDVFSLFTNTGRKN